MADITSTASAVARYPKRKRVEVDYYEDDVPGENTQFEGDSQEMQCSQPKKRKSANVKPRPKRKVFPFLDLPAEVRNMIYGHCLTDLAGIHLNSVTKKFRRTVGRVSVALSENGEVQPLSPALLAVCKQMYLEGRTMLYGNDFFIQDTMTMHAFAVDIGPRAASLLKRLTLLHWGEGRGVHKAYNHACFSALSSATNLEKMEFLSQRSYSSNPIHVARQLYRDAFPWLEAVGVAKGKAVAAVDVIEFSHEATFYRRGRRGWRHRMNDDGNDDNDQESAADENTEVRGELSKLLNDRMKMIWS